MSAAALCGQCAQPVSGKVITALGKRWHMEHFSCEHCHRVLGSGTYYDKDGAPFCEECHSNLFAPKCAQCNMAVVGKCLTALDKTWHPEHFVCNGCQRGFDDNAGFHEQEGRPFCTACFNERFSPRCAKCRSPIVGSYITALNQQWHAQCFVCKDCQQPFEGGQFYEIEGAPLCELDYHRVMGLFCAACGEAVKGRCVTAMERKFHPEHFVCASCRVSLVQVGFVEGAQGQPLCERCAQ